jgi:uncharacterized OB-fold protein
VGGGDHRLRAQVFDGGVDVAVGPARARGLGKGRRRRMQSYCHFCAAKLRGLRMWCPDCRRSTIGWLHVALIAALDAAGLVYLLRLF